MINGVVNIIVWFVMVIIFNVVFFGYVFVVLNLVIVIVVVDVVLVVVVVVGLVYMVMLVGVGGVLLMVSLGEVFLVGGLLVLVGWLIVVLVMMFGIMVLEGLGWVVFEEVGLVVVMLGMVGIFGVVKGVGVYVGFWYGFKFIVMFK